MALSWSHSVLFVQDEQKMLDFYTRVLGFHVTDRGPITDGREIIFMSQQPDEHHQVGFMLGRSDSGASNSVAHLAFRVGELTELRDMIGKLEAEDLSFRPTSHGNTWSVYFQDPEMNGVEILCNTPWHVQQPQGKVWDIKMDDDALAAWTKETFQAAEDFRPQAEYVERRRKALAAT
jgi:catechol 2,3-dioxygenase